MIDGWLPDLARSGGAKYLAIVDALEQAIAHGELAAGDRLPPQRDVAARLGVDLTTVTRAYDAARHRGLIEARGRAGSFVQGGEPAQSPATPVPLDNGMNMPPELPGGLLARAYSDGIAALLRNGGGARLQYQPPGGSAHDRGVAADLLTRRGLESPEEQVVVTAGGQNALHAILSAALAKGDKIACGTHVYPGFKGIAERLGIGLVPLAAMTADSLRRAHRQQAVRALYVVPTNDNPTTATLGLSERQAIADAAIDCGIQIIEDDAYGPLAADPLPALARLAPGQSWHVASTSKILSPALRVAHVRAPNIAAALRLAVDAHETAIMAPPLNTALVSAWIEERVYDRLLAAMRAECARRQAIARDALAGLGFASHPQGYHLWMDLPEGQSAAAIVDRMRPTGISVIAADRFAVEPGPEQAIRISLGGAVDSQRLDRGLRLLAGHLSAASLRASTFV